MDAIKEMKRLAQQNEVAALVIKELATFKTAQPSTDIYRRRVNIQKTSGRRFSKEEVEEVFSDFARQRWGKLTRARGTGEHGRFDWHPSFDYRAVAQAALSDIPSRISAASALPVDRSTPKPSQGGPVVVFTLSSGQEVRLTMSEARELKSQLQSI